MVPEHGIFLPYTHRKRSWAASSLHSRGISHPVHVRVEPALQHRDRLTVAFRLLLALPHLILVGGPVAAGWALTISSDWTTRMEAYLLLLHDEYPPFSFD